MSRTKPIWVILCIACIIIPIIMYGVAIVKTWTMDANCISYFEMAADANSVELAEKHLSSGIKYLEDNDLTHGNTKIFVYKPTKDIGLWYENLKSAQSHQLKNNNYGDFKCVETEGDMKFPTSVLEFSKPHPSISVHPTQKPVELLEWLIKTYTNEGEIVVDNCMGSGSTGVSALKTGRKFLGIELEQDYFDIARSRMA